MKDITDALVPFLAVAVTALGIILNSLRNKIDSISHAEYRTATIEQSLKDISENIRMKMEKINELEKKYTELAVDISKTLVLLKEIDKKTEDNKKMSMQQARDFDQKDYNLLVKLLNKYFEDGK